MAAVGTMVKKVLVNSPVSLGDVFNVVGAGLVYGDSRSKGDSKAVSLGKSVADFALGEMLGWWALPFYGAIAAGQIGVGVGKANAEAIKQHRELGSGLVGSGSFNMNGAGYTMRQRALNQIKNNGTQINSVLGNEARTYFRSNAYN